MFTTFKTETTYLTLKRNDGSINHVETAIHYAYDCDYSRPDFDFGNKDDNAIEMKRFESGELLNLCLKVTATSLQVGYSDYLGQCFVSAKNLENELLNIAIEYDLKNQACIGLKNELIGTYNTLKNIFEVSK